MSVKLNKEGREKLADWYIKDILKKQYKRNGMQLSEPITPDMIQSKREQLMVFRALKQLKEAIHGRVS